LDGADP
jgi:hypothetical protein